MWVLENDGDALQGRKLWLRPGKKFLFGRTLSDVGQFVISDKTISRQHLTVQVGLVGPEDCANPRARSKIILADLDTKIGTLVNGEQIRGKSHELSSDENLVSLGRYKHLFRFTWVPVTFSFSFTSKEQKANPFTSLYEILGPLDIKVISDYERGHTTHLVAKKRNTSKGLQALIDGKYIVHNDSFINAIVAAATPPADGSKPESPLEEDFVGTFPYALQYLPPRGDDKTQLPDDSYAPNPDRQDIFEGYTFVFYESRQYEILLAPITDGRGKALVRQAIPFETTVDEFVRYVKNVAGEKGLGEFEDGSEGKGVVVVRFNTGKDSTQEWYAEFGRQVALHLDHRLIEQNEFLDAILGNDASVLRRPLDIEVSGVVSTNPVAGTAATTMTLQSSKPAFALTPAEPAPQAPARRGRSRRQIISRFTGFDDDDDDETPSVPVSMPELIAIDETPAVQSQSQGLFVSQDPGMDAGREQSEPAERSTRSRRKRITSPIEEEEEDMMEVLAPAAAALKRRRLADDVARRGRGESTPPPLVVEKPIVVKVPPKKVKKEIDVLEVARQQREKEEAIAKAEREALQEAMDGMDIEAIRNLAIVEEMDVRRSKPPPLAYAQADESERWDDRWNGRKNFKKFRRRAAAGDSSKELNRVIVPLEEVKKKDFGIGDEYWLEGDSQRKKKKGKGKETQDGSQSEPMKRARNRAGTPEPEPLEIEEEPGIAVRDNAAESSDVEIVPEPPKAASTTRSQRAQKPSDKSKTSQNSKRPASSSLTKPAPPKKARSAIGRQDSDGSEDELRFRFRKRN